MSKKKFPTLDRHGKCRNKDMYFSVLSSSFLQCASLLLISLFFVVEIKGKN